MAFLDLISADPGSFPYIAYIETTFPNGQRVSGTGTLIAPKVVLTAGHIVFDSSRNGKASSVDVRFGDGRWFTTQVVDYPEEWRDAANGSLEISTVSDVDIGVIVLPVAVDQLIPLMPFQTASDSMLTAMSLNVSGFPTEPPDNGVRGSMLWGRNCNLLQDGDLVALGLNAYEPFRLFYPVNTREGMSGCPVYDFDPVAGRTLRGIHTSGPTPSSPSFPGSALRITKGIYLTIQDWVTTFQP